MKTGRLEAFSDGVFAIVITIMVLELKAPHDADADALSPLWPKFLSYILSFVYVGLYWNNHHHLFHAVEHVTGGTLWANLYLLFWLSLLPAVTSWMGENQFGMWPVAAYGFVLLMSAAAWEVLRRILIHSHERGSALSRAMRKSRKEVVSLVLYAAAVGVAFVSPPVACAIYAVVAAIWLVPDRHIEREMDAE